MRWPAKTIFDLIRDSWSVPLSWAIQLTSADISTASKSTHNDYRRMVKR